MTTLIFCEYHFRLFRDNGILKILTDNPNTIIGIKKHEDPQTVCSKIHCSDKAHYEMEII